MTDRVKKILVWLARRGMAIVWSVLLIAGTGAVLYFFMPCIEGAECSGGSRSGLWFGLIGAAAIFATMLYTLRKDTPRWSVFPLEHWLYGHVVIGALSLALVIAHSGFRLGNREAVLALGFLALTVVSGTVGLFIFYFVPRGQVRQETSVLIPEDLCRRLTRLHGEISEICSGRGGVFLTLYNELVIPIYRTRVGKQPPHADVSRWADNASPEEGEDFMRLAVKIEDAHDTLVLLGKHMRFRWIVQGWLMVHVPATLGLLVFTIVHVISMTWYGVP